MDAFERFRASALPSDVEEVWRYSRIDDLDLDAYEPAGPAAAPAGIPDEVVPALEAVGPRDGLLVVRNGRIVHAELSAKLEQQGVLVGDVTGAPDGDDLLGSVGACPSEGDALCELNAAFTTEAVLVRVPAGVVVERPLVVIHWIDVEGVAVFPRTVVHVGPDAQATVVDLHASSDVAALSVPVTELDVADAGRLRYVTTQSLGQRVWQVAYQASRAGRDATIQSAAVAVGGDYARLRTDSRLEGKGGSAELLAVYFGEGTQMHDFRTMQDHVAPNTTSDLVFKGAVEDQARSVYSGLIRVRKAAQGTNAMQTNRNLVLSEGSHADSVPNLEIEANDVRCSHASAVGPVDEDQRYYLESRGVPTEAAERLIVLGFFAEVLERLPVSTLAEGLRWTMAEKLNRRSA